MICQGPRDHPFTSPLLSRLIVRILHDALQPNGCAPEDIKCAEDMREMLVASALGSNVAPHSVQELFSNLPAALADNATRAIRVLLVKLLDQPLIIGPPICSRHEMRDLRARLMSIVVSLFDARIGTLLENNAYLPVGGRRRPSMANDDSCGICHIISEFRDECRLLRILRPDQLLNLNIHKVCPRQKDIQI